MMLHELAEVISSVDVVCFDIFDTLLIRDVLEPRDIWRVVEEDYVHPEFLSKRVSADAVTYRQATASGGEHTFSAIQGILGKDMADALGDELSVEALSLRANPDVVEIWDKAGELGKKRIIASDMYLSGDFLAQVLERNGISGWDALYVSCDRQCRKSTGELFKLILQELDLKPFQVLHIGDNVISDGEQPVELGIRNYLYPNFRRSFFERFPFADEYLQYNGDFEGKRLVGALASGWHIYSSSQQKTSFWEALGFMFAGVLGYAYVKWIGDKARAMGITHLMFVGRDGYIWSRMARLLFPELTSDYFLAPRTISVRIQGVIGDCANAVKDRQRYIDEELGGVLDREKALKDYAEYLGQFSIDAENTALIDGISSAFSAQRMVEAVVGTSIYTFYLASDKKPYHGASLFQSDKQPFSFQDFSEFLFGSPEPPVQYASKAGLTYSSTVDPYEKIKMDASPLITKGAVACAEALHRAHVLVAPQDWLEYYDAYMRHLTTDDLRHLALARNSTAVNHTTYCSIVSHPRPKLAVKLSCLGFPVLKVRYDWHGGAFRRTLLLCGRWRLFSKEVKLYTLADVSRTKVKK